MKLKSLFIFCFLLLGLSCNQATQEKEKETTTDAKLSPAETLLKQCIAFHDPDGKWANLSTAINSSMSLFKWDEAKQDTIVTMRNTDIMMDNAKSLMEVHRMTEGFKLVRTIIGDSICQSTWEKPEVSAADSAQFNLGCEPTRRYRNYYRYMLGLPMVLNDKQAILSNTVGEVEVNGKACKVLTVNYAPQDQEPTWTFYIDSNSFQLVRAKFVKPVEAGKEPSGEIIDFPTISNFQGMKLLSTYRWMLLDGAPLGDDVYTFKPL